MGVFFAVTTLFYGAIGIVPPLLPLIRGDFQVSIAAVGWVNAIFALARLGVNVPVGRAVDRHSPFRVWLLGIVLTALGYLLCGLAWTFEVLLAGRALAGVGFSTAAISTTALLIVLSPVRKRGRLFSLFEFCAVGGMVMGAPLAGAVAGRWGWRAVFLLAAGSGLLTLAGAGRFGWQAAWGRPAPRPAGPRLRPDPAPDGAAGRPRSLVPIFTSAFAMSFIWTGLYYTLFPLYGADEIGLGPGFIGSVMAMGFAVDMAMLLPAGWASDRWSRMPLVNAGLVAAGLSAWMLPFASGPSWYLWVAVLVGLAFSTWGVLASAVADTAGAQGHGRLVAGYRTVIDLGFFLGPVVGSGLAGRFGYGVATAALGASAVAALAINWRFRG